MSKLLRYYADSNTYFLTIVTYDRREILSENCAILLSSLQQAIAKHEADPALIRVAHRNGGFTFRPDILMSIDTLSL